MQVARPLHELTSGEKAGKKKVAITWNDRCQQSSDDLKHLCTMAPILAYTNFMEPSKLHLLVGLAWRLSSIRLAMLRLMLS